MSDEHEGQARVVHTPYRNELGGVNREQMMCGEDFDRLVMNDETYSLSERRVTCVGCLDAIRNDRRTLHLIPENRRGWSR